TRPQVVGAAWMPRRHHLCFWSGSPQQAVREGPLRIRPPSRAPESRRRRHAVHFIERVLVRALRPDAFALADRKVEPGARDGDVLITERSQVHLDPPLGRVVARLVTEAGGLEVRPQLAVHAREEIE